MKLLQVDERNPFDLVDDQGQKVAGHVFPIEHQRAIEAALAAQRPLLVLGEPGTGKSQLARAAAQALKRVFVSMVVDSQTLPRDLHYHLDSVERLAEAQNLSLAKKGDQESVHEFLALENFLRPGPLWWAFHHEEAKTLGHKKESKETNALPAQAKGSDSKNGVVLLIDEIDKADPSVPNGLLEALADGSFARPDRRRVVQTGPFPLIVITSNDERPLPAPFIRRCMVLKLAFPEKEEAFQKEMVLRGKAHFDGSLDEDTLQEAARQLWQDRQEHIRVHKPPPGQAEYLDLLRAVLKLAPQLNQEPAELVEELAQFTFKKHL
ncbi:MAG: AAA family ATPase [Planctomycetota bacterium]|nr:MAG: AAA family ATPase [Planctomycetota bacterium]